LKSFFIFEIGVALFAFSGSFIHTKYKKKEKD